MARKKQEILIKNRSRLILDGIVFDFYPGDKWRITAQYPGKPEHKEISAALIPELKDKMII